jgi:aryl-alcohol dehydrogenase-like predicted oxidoreductase
MSAVGRRDFLLLGAGGLAVAVAGQAAAQTTPQGAANMERRRLGTLNCSIVGAGLYQLGRDGDYARAERIVHAGLDAGINFYDTANIYGNTPQATYNSEAFLGRALGRRRSQVYIATKLGYDRNSGSTAMPPPFGGLRAADVQRELDESLRRLRTDYIDLYQTHQPDPNTPIEETLGAFQRAIEQGKVRYVGVSNHNPQMLRADAAARRSLGLATPGFVSTQNGFSLLRRQQAEVMPVLDELDMGFIPHTPLANGMLTGKYRRDQPLPEGSTFAAAGPEIRARMLTPRFFDFLEAMTAYAGDHGHSMLDLAFAWLASHPRLVTVIAGLTQPQYAAQNVRAAEWRLTPAQVAEVNAIAERLNVPAGRVVASRN